MISNIVLDIPQLRGEYYISNFRLFLYLSPLRSPSLTKGAVGPPDRPVLYVGGTRVIPDAGKADRGGKHSVVTLPEGKQLAAGGQVVWLRVVAQNTPALTQFVQVGLITTEVTPEIKEREKVCSPCRVLTEV